MSTSVAVAAVRPDLLDPHEALLAHVFGGPADGDDVAVDLGHGIGGVVHVRLDDLDVHLLPLPEGQRPFEHLLAVPLEQNREVVDRESLGTLEVEPLAGLLLDGVEHAGTVAGELGADPGVHLDQQRFGLGLLGQVPHAPLELDRDRLLGLDHALTVARRARPGHDLPDALGDVLAGHLDQAQRRDLHHEGLRPILVERLAQRLQHRVTVARAGHVDEVDDDDPADVPQTQLAHDLVGRLEVGLGDRVLEPRALATADEAARVDVDHRQRLGVVDDQIPAAGQIDPARERRVEHLLDAEGLEQRFLLLPQLDVLDQLGSGAGEERDQTMVLLGVIDDRALEFGGDRCPAPHAPTDRPPGRPAPALPSRPRASAELRPA